MSLVETLTLMLIAGLFYSVSVRVNRDEKKDSNSIKSQEVKHQNGNTE